MEIETGKVLTGILTGGLMAIAAGVTKLFQRVRKNEQSLAVIIERQEQRDKKLDELSGDMKEQSKLLHEIAGALKK